MLATLIGVLGDFDLAEDALQDAVAVALERWPQDGVPTSPAGWLVTTARNRAIDRIRRERNLQRKTELLARLETAPVDDLVDDTTIPDERLSLIFACCHPALAARGAGRADAPLARRPGDRRDRARVPRPRADAWRSGSCARSGRSATRASRSASRPTHLLPERLGAVLRVVYLIFNAGYGPPVRPELCAEAIRLATLLATLMPDEAEVHGLHALLLFQDARRDARVRDGALVLLEEQDRGLWDSAEIAAGHETLRRALSLPARGPYLLQAGIAAAHSDDVSDWPRIVGLYRRLAELAPSPVVELNRAVAVAMADGPEAGLALVDAIAGLDDYHLFHSARADLLRRLDRGPESAAAYERARASSPRRARGARVATSSRSGACSSS